MLTKSYTYNIIERKKSQAVFENLCSKHFMQKKSFVNIIFTTIVIFAQRSIWNSQYVNSIYRFLWVIQHSDASFCEYFTELPLLFPRQLIWVNNFYLGFLERNFLIRKLFIFFVNFIQFSLSIFYTLKNDFLNHFSLSKQNSSKNSKIIYLLLPYITLIYINSILLHIYHPFADPK